MKQKNLMLVLLNSITFVLMLFINYSSNARVFSDVTVADIAHKYDTLFAPADYAFIIWGVIFLLGLGFVIYQWALIKDDKKRYIQRTGLWFALSNIANALWVYCWIHEWMGFCVVLILILLLSLIALTIRLRIALDDEPVRTIFFVWWPVAVYLGWIMVATIAAIASWLVSIHWSGFGIAPDVWTIIMIIIACVLYIYLNQTRNLRESASVGIWAFIAIAVRQLGVHDDIAITAILASVILTVLIARHFYKNRYYIPFVKIKRGEWK
jgi:hypothetical protein